MNRDWQDDKTNNLLKRCEIAKSYNETISVWPDAIIELINKATAEKARADQAEAREQKLKEAIEAAINEKAQWGDAGNALDVVVRYLSDTLSILCPKEATE